MASGLLLALLFSRVWSFSLYVRRGTGRASSEGLKKLFFSQAPSPPHPKPVGGTPLRLPVELMLA